MNVLAIFFVVRLRTKNFLRFFNVRRWKRCSLEDDVGNDGYDDDDDNDGDDDDARQEFHPPTRSQFFPHISRLQSVARVRRHLSFLKLKINQKKKKLNEKNSSWFHFAQLIDQRQSEFLKFKNGRIVADGSERQLLPDQLLRLQSRGQAGSRVHPQLRRRRLLQLPGLLQTRVPEPNGRYVLLQERRQVRRDAEEPAQVPEVSARSLPGGRNVALGHPHGRAKEAKVPEDDPEARAAAAARRPGPATTSIQAATPETGGRI